MRSFSSELKKKTEKNGGCSPFPLSFCIPRSRRFPTESALRHTSVQEASSHSIRLNVFNDVAILTLIIKVRARLQKAGKLSVSLLTFISSHECSRGARLRSLGTTVSPCSATSADPSARARTWPSRSRVRPVRHARRKNVFFCVFIINFFG